MITLDEAIKHAEEVAEEKENEGKLLCQSEGASIGCLTCAEEHRQLAEWLKELKYYKENQRQKIGKWLNIELIPNDITGHAHGECSLCGKVRIVDNYCPNCRAQMEVEA